MTKPNNRKRIPIPKDIQPGDVLVLSDGKIQTVAEVYRGGDVATNYENIYHGDGSRYRDNGPEFVIAIERKAKAKPPPDDKDAVWLMKRATAFPTCARRYKEIARRLNGGKGGGA